MQLGLSTPSVIPKSLLDSTKATNWNASLPLSMSHTTIGNVMRQRDDKYESNMASTFTSATASGMAVESQRFQSSMSGVLVLSCKETCTSTLPSATLLVFLASMTSLVDLSRWQSVTSGFSLVAT